MGIQTDLNELSLVPESHACFHLIGDSRGGIIMILTGLNTRMPRSRTIAE